MKTDDDGNLFGRIVALALILGAAYGAHAIARGKFNCGLEGTGGCCLMEHHDEAAPAEGSKPGAAVKPETDGDEDDAKLEAKAPVVPPKQAE